MEWLNLHSSTLKSPECVGSSPAELGTWIRVLAYACAIECGGRIPGAATWKDAQWVHACAVHLREVKASHRLLRFDGADLLVNGYPEARERQVVAGRKHALAGALARWGKPALGHALPMPLPDAEGEGEGKEKSKAKENARAQAELDIFAAKHPDTIWTPKPTLPKRFDTCEQEWTLKVRHEPFGVALIAANVKFPQRDWPIWRGMIDRVFAGDTAACMAVAVTVPADVRWPDRVEAAHAKANKPDPQAAADAAIKAKYGKIK